MKMTLVSHEPPALGSLEELHRFGFEADDGLGLLTRHEITLRTVRVIAANLDGPAAITKMMRSIVSTKRADYDTLISNIYADDNDADDSPHAAAPARTDEKDRVPRMDDRLAA